MFFIRYYYVVFWVFLCYCTVMATDVLQNNLLHDAGACGGVLQATGVAQAIFSPGYLSGSAYSVPTKCIWRIEVYSLFISLSFLFNLFLHVENN